jgi:hypothetical protein
MLQIERYIFSWMKRNGSEYLIYFRVTMWYFIDPEVSPIFEDMICYSPVKKWFMHSGFLDEPVDL